MNDRPAFDISSLLRESNLREESHDAFGKSPGLIGVEEQDAHNADRVRPAPLPENDPQADPINPAHYRRHPSGIECIEVTRHLNFNIGNAIKYLWRYLDKGDPVENLKKAQWYIDDEIRRLQGMR